jgi:response regulator aspartate phosphatase I
LLESYIYKKERIPYEVLISKLNTWYTTIRKNMIDETKKKKSKIESLLEEVEMKQEVLLYYQLLDFRHELILIYLRSKDV